MTPAEAEAAVLRAAANLLRAENPTLPEHMGAWGDGFTHGVTTAADTLDAVADRLTDGHQ